MTDSDGLLEFRQFKAYKLDQMREKAKQSFFIHVRVCFKIML